MYITKVLKRKDASSVIVAIWLAFLLQQALYLPTFHLVDMISGIGDSHYQGMYGAGSPGWRNEYLNPIVTVLLNIIVIEILIRLFVVMHPLFVRKSK